MRVSSFVYFYYDSASGFQSLQTFQSKLLIYFTILFLTLL